jgi:ribosomal protein S9
MARKYASTGSVETIRKRLGRTLSQFSEDLGFGLSAYGYMVRNDKVTENARSGCWPTCH